MIAFDAIDHVLSHDLGGRGIARFFTPGAAMAAAHALLRSRRVLITTGFCVGPDLPETDGPPGAAVLGSALRRLGARVVYVTDRPNVRVLEAALKALGELSEVDLYPDGAGAAPAVLATHRPTHVIAIERPGRARSGDYLNARGQSVKQWNAPIDELFLVRSRRLTLAIGDGGNEIGMGNAHARVAGQSALMARITSIVRADHLVVAGTSNWGAYGVVAALQRLSKRALLHSPDVERRLIAACAKAGAVDGITRRREATVDGLPASAHAAVVELLALAAETGERGIMSRPVDRRERGAR